MPAPETPAVALASELEALQVRQAALHEALVNRNTRDAEALSSVEATFGRLPEYIEKLQRVQQSMNVLAMRTSQMRERCVALSEQR